MLLHPWALDTVHGGGARPAHLPIVACHPAPFCTLTPFAELIAESASTALGGVAAGNLGAYLPLLLQHVHAQASSPKQLYQLLKVGSRVRGGGEKRQAWR